MKNQGVSADERSGPSRRFRRSGPLGLRWACAWLLLAFLAGGCSSYEKVQLNTAWTTFSASGKCEQLFGPRTYRVECPIGVGRADQESRHQG